MSLSAAGRAQPVPRRPDFGNVECPWSNSFDRGLASVTEWKWLDLKGTTPLAVRSGRHDRTDSGFLAFSSVTYGDLDGDGRDEAAVDLIRGSGGSATWHYLYVFRIEGAMPKPIALLRSGSRANGGLTGVAIDNRVLILEFNDPDFRTADCCSDGFIRVRYKYDGARFIETPPRVKGLRQK